MPLTDMFQVGKIKAELEQVRQERDALKQLLAETERLELYEIQQRISQLAGLRAQAESDLQATRERAARESQTLDADFAQKRRGLDAQLADLERQITARKQEVVVLDDEILLQSFGFYKPRYDLENSEQYRARLQEIRAKQAGLVRVGGAATCPTHWTVNNDAKEGARMVKDFQKLIVRSFNNECDASIVGVKFNNVEAIEQRIRKAYDVLNTLGRRMSISITSEYYWLKINELYLVYEYQLKKQEEKEEQRRLREELREEAKVAREIEAMKVKLEKEETHFERALRELEARLETVSSAEERVLLEHEREGIEQQLARIEKDKLDVQNREQNTRAGYVYVISNVGAFGENVFKIGVTRRLDPQERVDELGDASVPFHFDVHAMIFSDDAPALEGALHKAFEQRRMNLVNTRREFFRVSLDEIEQVVRRNFTKPAEIKRLADAEEYRQSELMRGSLAAS
jgi:hypothetical protein